MEEQKSALCISKRKSQVTAQSIKEALVEQGETGDCITELGQKLQQERVDKAEDKLNSFKKFKQDIGVGACRAQRYCEELRVKIHQRIYNNSMPEGVLTHDLFAYLDCIKLDENKLDMLLSNDESYWLKYL